MKSTLFFIILLALELWGLLEPVTVHWEYTLNRSLSILTCSVLFVQSIVWFWQLVEEKLKTHFIQTCYVMML